MYHLWGLVSFCVISALLHRFRPPSDADLGSLGAYRAAVQELAARLHKTCDAWDGVRQLEPDTTRLANTAAVNRWETVRLAHHVDQLDVPRMIGNLHRDLSAAAG